MLDEYVSIHAGCRSWLLSLEVGETVKLTMDGTIILFVRKGAIRSYSDMMNNKTLAEEEMGFISGEGEYMFSSLKETEVLFLHISDMGNLFYVFFPEMIFKKRDLNSFLHPLPIKEAIKTWMYTMFDYINSYYDDEYLLNIKTSELLLLMKAVYSNEDLSLFFSITDKNIYCS